MKRLLALLFFAAPMLAQGPSADNLPALAGYFYNGSNWTPLTTSGTAGSAADNQPAFGIWGFNATTGKWYPCGPSNACLGASSSYTGLVGTRTDLPATQNNGSGLSQFMMRSFHFARTAIPANTALPVMANAYVTTTNVETSAGTGTYRLSIEYPAGTIAGNCVFSGGSTTATVTGATLVIPSSCPHAAIPNGAMFWVRAYVTNPSGILYTLPANVNYYNTAYEQYAFAASGLADQTAGGTVTNTASGYGLHPAAILGQTSAPSICIVGDSREHGVAQAITDITGDTGTTAKLLGPVFAYTKLAMVSTSASTFLANDALRLQIGQYCTHVVDNYGVNDAAAGQTIAQIIANRTAIAAAFGKPTYGTTVQSKTSSTDNWATLANQTVVNGLSTLSAAILAGVPGEVGEIDVAGALDPTASNKFPVSPNVFATTGTAYYGTPDGTHNSGTLDDLIHKTLGYVATWFHR